MLNNFKAYIFDLDGTILDSNSLNLESFLYTCRKHLDKDIPQEEIIKLFGRPLFEQMEYFSTKKAKDMVNTYRTYTKKVHDQKVNLFPQSKSILKKLNKKNYKCVLVTSKTKYFAQRALNLFEIDQYFKIKIFYEDSIHHKPSPEPYLLALNKINLPINSILSIGDSPYDIIASKRAGLKTAIVGWSQFSKKQIQQAEPDYIINTFNEII